MADEVDLAEIVAKVSRNLRRACAVGHPAPVVASMWEDMTNPQPGDLVLEVSRLRQAPFDPDCLGRLVRVESDEVRGAVWFVVPLAGMKAGQEVRWENADFVKVLTERPRDPAPHQG